MIHIILIAFTILSLFLAGISYHYFSKLMKLVKVRMGNILVFGAFMLLAGYIFFLLPWIFVGEDIYEIRLFSYFLILVGLFIIVYGVVKIYLDWKGVVK